MALITKWSNEKYALWVKGDTEYGIPSLRSVMRGFDSRNGFNLKNVDSWTRGQKQKIRNAAKRIDFLQAQDKSIYRPKKGENLKSLQKGFHGSISSKDMKVAFIPTIGGSLTEDKVKPLKIKYVEGGISVKQGRADRFTIFFDQKRLAEDAAAEVKRAASMVPDARLFFVKAGEFQSLTGKSLVTVTNQIIEWMHMYDGKRALPEHSGNKGDDPKKHHWKIWLEGLIALKFPKAEDRMTMARKIVAGMHRNRELRHERKKFMSREGRKGRKKK